MSTTRLAFALTAGIVATVNPCGFAMLPAYLSFFLGIEQRSERSDAGRGIGRALITGATVTLGITSVFGVVGIALSLGLNAIRDWVPWAAMLIGCALVALGVAMIAGFRLNLMLPKFQQGTAGRDLRSLFGFGVSYAVASISCGLATFLVVVTSSVGSFFGGVVSFMAYALGMGLVLTSLAVSLAVARSWLLRRLRVLMRFTDQIAAVLLIAAGLFTVWYWLTDLSGRRQGGVIVTVERWSANLANWVSSIGGVRLSIIMSIVVALAAMALLVRGMQTARRTTTADTTTAAACPADPAGHADDTAAAEPAGARPS